MLPKGWRCRSETFFHLWIPAMKCSLQWTWNNRITKGKTLLWQQNISILSELSVRKEATVWFKQKQTLQNKKCNHDFKTKSQFSPICDGIPICNSLFSGIFWACRNIELCFMASETETGVKWANLRRHSSFLTKLDTECSWFRKKRSKSLLASVRRQSEEPELGVLIPRRYLHIYWSTVPLQHNYLWLNCQEYIVRACFFSDFWGAQRSVFPVSYLNYMPRSWIRKKGLSSVQWLTRTIKLCFSVN